MATKDHRTLVAIVLCIKVLLKYAAINKKPFFLSEVVSCKNAIYGCSVLFESLFLEEDVSLVQV